MGTTIKPEIIELTPSEAKFFDDASQTNKIVLGKLVGSENLIDFPCVYIHSWKHSKHPHSKYDVYVGESNDFARRTGEHFKAGSKEEVWQKRMLDHISEPDSKHYVIYHKHFNKSMTLDVEDRLMEYISSMYTASLVNGRPNPQNQYYPNDETEDIFSMIWHGLRRNNNLLFLSETQIKSSAIFKASPFKKLTNEQKEAKALIIDKTVDALKTGRTGQLIFVEGETGSGKTILTSSTFYDMLYNSNTLFNRDVKCYLLVNHDEQEGIFEKIAKSTGIFRTFNNDVVSKPTTFVNNHDATNLADIAFVDEAHLLWTQGHQSYTGKNLLLDIIKRARVTVIMYDKFQTLTSNQVWDTDILDKLRAKAIAEGNYIKLNMQMRMEADKATKEWIDDFTFKHIVKDLNQVPGKEYIKVFDDPNKLYSEIKKKAAVEKTHLSRMIASYDWQYIAGKNCPTSKYWEVSIGKPVIFHLPWNYEIKRFMTRKEKQAIKYLSWAEQPHTINEIGSTYTVQGSDLHYAGLIIGPSVSFDGTKIVIKDENSKNIHATNKRKVGKKGISYAKELIAHELRVLMTRGVKGLYIYACDEDLRKELLKRIK